MGRPMVRRTRLRLDRHLAPRHRRRRAQAAYTPANATTPSTSKPPSTPSSTTPNTWPPPTTNNDESPCSDTPSHSEGNRLQPSRPSASRHEDGSAPMESGKAAALFQSRGGCAGMPVRKSRCSAWKGIGRFQRHLFGDYPVRPGAGAHHRKAGVLLRRFRIPESDTGSATSPEPDHPPGRKRRELAPGFDRRTPPVGNDPPPPRAIRQDGRMKRSPPVPRVEG